MLRRSYRNGKNVYDTFFFSRKGAKDAPSRKEIPLPFTSLLTERLRVKKLFLLISNERPRKYLKKKA